jgi:hypothetical protein
VSEEVSGVKMPKKVENAVSAALGSRKADRQAKTLGVEASSHLIK